MQVVPDWLRGLLTTPTEELNRWQKGILFFKDLCVHGAHQLRKDRAPQMAAALAYRTLFSIVPLLVVSVVILNWVYGPQAFESPLQRVLAYLGLDRLSVAGGDGTNAAAGTQSVDQLLRQLVEKAESLHMGTIGLVGLAILIYAALSLLVQVESSFNVIYSAPTGRSWIRRLTQYWTLITLGPLLMIASFNVQGRVVEVIENSSTAGVIVGVAGFILTVGITWLLLYVAYETVPNARVHMKPALTGSFVAALLWEGSKHAFTIYVGRHTGYGQIYGSLALLPVFMLWVYITWLIVLFGLELSHILQTVGKHRERLSRVNESGKVIVDPACVLAVAGLAARQFENGMSLSPGRVSRELGINEKLAREVLLKLTEKGFLHETDGEESQVRFTLARPADKIRNADLLVTGFELAGSLRGETSAEFLRRLRESQLEKAGDSTLADMIHNGEEDQAADQDKPTKDPATDEKPATEAVSAKDGRSGKSPKE